MRPLIEPVRPSTDAAPNDARGGLNIFHKANTAAFIMPVVHSVFQPQAISGATFSVTIEYTTK
jgi:hypothetical protein